MLGAQREVSDVCRLDLTVVTDTIMSEFPLMKYHETETLVLVDAGHIQLIRIMVIFFTS